jgi:hypothetical protein
MQWCNRFVYFEYSGFEEDALIMQVGEFRALIVRFNNVLSLRTSWSINGC